jgi:hypothetical protein
MWKQGCEVVEDRCDAGEQDSGGVGEGKPGKEFPRPLLFFFEFGVTLWD